MKTIKESILSSTGSGKTEYIKTFIDNLFISGVEYKQDYYINDDGTVNMWRLNAAGNGPSTIIINEGWPDYVRFSGEFLHGRGKKGYYQIHVKGNKAFEKFLYAFGQCISIGNEINPFSVYFEGCTIDVSKLPRIFGCVTFEKCKTDATKGLNNIYGQIYVHYGSIQKPYAIENITKFSISNR